MRPILPLEKKRKMVSFMISPEAQAQLEKMFSDYKEKIFFRFTKTDIFEIAIKNLAKDLTKKTMQEMYDTFIRGKNQN